MITSLIITPLEKAVSQLLEGFKEAEANPANELLRDGVIQRFEYTMDLAWKYMQRVLKHVYQIQQTEMPGKKDIFRKAAERGLIPNAESWIAHYEARNQTSHDYDMHKAAIVYAQVKLFLPDVQYLLEALRRVS